MRSGTFAVKLFGVIALVSLSASLTATYLTYNAVWNRELARVQSNLQAFAEISARLIDGDALAALATPSQENSPQYLTIQKTLAAVQQGDADIRFVYTMRRTPHGQVAFVVDTPPIDYNSNGRVDPDERMAHLGETYKDSTPSLLAGFERPSAEPQPSSDEWGLLLSAYAPIRDSRGVSVGLVGVDMLASRLAELRHQFLMQSLLILVGVVLGSLFLAAAVAWHLGQPLRMLQDGIRVVRDGSLEVRLDAASQSGEFREVMETFNEMTAKRRELEVHLRQSAQLEAVAQLAAGVAHDLKNHLTPILGYAELLLRRLPADSHEHGLVAALGAAAERAAELTRKLLAFSRREEGKCVSLDLHQAVHDTLQLLQPCLDSRHEVIIELHARQTMLIGDPQQFVNALLNLGLNARDAMPEGGTLTITTSNPEAGRPLVRVIFRDTGIGMDAETTARIFEPFFTRKESGTGLGLTSVYWLVQQQGGAIRVESTPGQGSAFILDFNLVPVSEPLPAEGPTAPGRPGEGAATI